MRIPTLAGLLAGLLIFCSLATLPSCAYLKEAGKGLATDAVHDEIASRLPEEKRPEFEDAWSKDPGEGIVYAVETVGVDKFADLLEKMNEDNASLAAELREKGAEGLRDLWIQIALALAGGAATTIATRSKSKWARIAQAVINAGNVMIQKDTTGEAAATFKDAAKTQANALGVKPALDVAVAKATAGK